MQAIRYHELGDADVLELEEIDRPVPEKDEVLVEMKAASVNPVDTMFRSGAYGDVSLPAIPGGDGAGVVVEVGETVDDFEVGDRVFASGMGHADGGTFAEYVAFPEIKLAPLPDPVSFQAGGAIGNVGATAWTALEDVASVQPGDNVLVHGGAGGVGHTAVQIANTGGANVIATAAPDAHEAVTELGATSVVDYRSDSIADDVEAATNDQGVDVILDHMIGTHLETNLEAAAMGCHIVSIEGSFVDASADPLRQKEMTVRGISLGNRSERTPILNRLARLLSAGELRPVVAQTYEFDEVTRAHRDVVEGGFVGKLVVTP